VPHKADKKQGANLAHYTMAVLPGLRYYAPGLDTKIFADNGLHKNYLHFF
jgi:hypothetical protein